MRGTKGRNPGTGTYRRGGREKERADARRAPILDIFKCGKTSEMRLTYGALRKTAGAVAVSAALGLAASNSAMADCGFTGGNVANGDKIFHETCVTCHGEDGHGVIPGAPDFTKKGGVLSKPHAVMIEHIKNGFQAPGNPMAMPPKGGNPDLTDQDIKDVHQYLHHRFGCGK